ncbi:MAG: archaellum operon transcriptional activator EarA family protein [Thermoplasmatota archaeon]
MHKEDDIVTSPDILKPLIIRSLRRSNIRKKIAEYLFDISPSGSYTSEIAYNVKTTPTNVIGAIRGMNSRYRDEESLITLQIVEQIKSGRRNEVKLYKITDFGKDMIESIRETKRRY